MRKLTVLLVLSFLLISVFSVQAIAEEEEELYFRLVTHGGDDPFWAAVQNGMRDAAERYGVKANIDLCGGDLSEQKKSFEEAINMDVDGIALVINDGEAWDEPVEEALEEEIPVIGINNDDPEGANGNARLAYIGQDESRAGYRVAQRLFEEAKEKGMDLSNAHVAMPVEVPGATYGEIRSEGVKRAMEEYGITSSEIIDCGGLEMTTVEKRLNSYLLANPQTDFIIGLGGITTDRITSVLEGLDYNPGEIIAGGFDCTSGTLSGLEDDYMTVTIDQQQYLQGYYAVSALYLYNKYGFTPNIDTGGKMIEKEDVPRFKELSEQHIR